VRQELKGNEGLAPSESEDNLSEGILGGGDRLLALRGGYGNWGLKNE